VPALAREPPGRIKHHRPDQRVRLHGPATALGQRKGVPHPAFQVVRGRVLVHGEKNPIPCEPMGVICVYLAYTAKWNPQTTADI
jgi:hypothetical protein